MDPFRAARLAAELPPEGALGRSLGNEGFGPTENLLLAALDLLRQGNWLQANKGLPRSKQSKFPEPLPRPGQKAKTKATGPVTLQKLLDFKERHKRNHE
jgi:hypothetical protein